MQLIDESKNLIVAFKNKICVYSIINENLIYKLTTNFNFGRKIFMHVNNAKNSNKELFLLSSDFK